MEKWLEPVAAILNNVASQVRFFFRDDDAGWHDERLFKLIDCFSTYTVPLDLAAIPQAFDAPRAAFLRNLIEVSEQRVGIHQHGYTHLNHQIDGRKCEFGRDRSYQQQKFDIWMGQRVLYDYFGDSLDKIFTPPWNRCTQDTMDVLNEYGFSSISRDETAARLDTGHLVEMPVNINWFKKKCGVRLSFVEMGSSIAAAVEDGGVVGIMLHHEHVDQNERTMLSELLALFDANSNVECMRMRDLWVS